MNPVRRSEVIGLFFLLQSPIIENLQIDTKSPDSHVFRHILTYDVTKLHMEDSEFQNLLFNTGNSTRQFYSQNSERHISVMDLQDFFEDLRREVYDMASTASFDVSSTPPLHFLFSFSYNNYFNLSYYDDEWNEPAQDSECKIRNELPSVKISAVILEIDKGSTCQELESPFTLDYMSRISTLVRGATESECASELHNTKTGLGFNKHFIGCETLLPAISQSDVIVVTVTFGDTDIFIPSYDLFREYMDGIVTNFTDSVENLDYKPQLFIKIGVNFNFTLTPNITQRTDPLVASFARKWADLRNHAIIMQPGPANKGLLQVGTSFDEASLLLLSGPDRGESRPGLDEAKKCKPSVLALLNKTLSVFPVIELELDFFTNVLNCQKNKKIGWGTLKQLYIFVDLPKWKLDVMDEMKLCEDESDCEKLPAHSLIFNYQALEDMANTPNILRISESQIPILCSVPIQLQPGDDFRVVVSRTQELCNLDRHVYLSGFVWNIELGIDDAHEATEHWYSYFESVVHVQLGVLLTAREQTSAAVGYKQVVLRISLTKNSTLQSRHLGVYCDSSALRVNLYVEAIANWAYIHDFSLIFNKVDNVSCGWWTNLSKYPPQDVISSSNQLFAAFNYPDSMGYMGSEKCIHPSGKLNHSISFDLESIGVTFSTTINNISLSSKQLQTMMHLIFHKFKSAELRFTNDFLHDMDVLKGALTAELINDMEYDGIDNVKLYICIDNSTTVMDAVTKLGQINFNIPSGNRTQSVISIAGVHFSSMEYNPNTILEIHNLSKISGNKLRFGLVIKECTRNIQELMRHTTQPSKVISYFVCEEMLQIGNYQNLTSLGNYMKSQLYTKRAIDYDDYHILFRMQVSRPPRGDPLQHAENFLRYLNDMSKFNKAYNISYFITSAFDDPANDMKGWWRISDFGGDLSNPGLYFEHESDFLNASTWRPKYVKDRLVASDNLPKTLIYIVGALTVILASLCCIYTCYRRKHESNERGQSEKCLLGEEYEIPKDHFYLESAKIIGWGNFGLVYNTQMRHGEHLAVKVPRVTCPEENLTTMINEAKVMKHLGEHENIVGFIGAYTIDIQKGIIYIATELCINGPLLTFIRARRQSSISDVDQNDSALDHPFDLYQLLRFCTEIANGMEYISNKQVVHGDLSASNILLDQKLTCKITDFGLSCKLYDRKACVKSDQDQMKWRWMAYETIKSMEFSTKSDVWSFGVAMWEIFSLGSLPYSDISCWTTFTLENIKNGLRLDKPLYSTTPIYDTMLGCWNLKPEARPDFKQLTEYFIELRKDDYTPVCSSHDMHFHSSL